MILIDDQQQIVLMNPAAGLLCDWKPDDATGISTETVIKFVTEKGDPISDDNNPLLEVFDTKHSVKNNNLFLLKRDNKQISVALNVSPTH